MTMRSLATERFGIRLNQAWGAALALATMTAGATWALPAAAHGGFPRAFEILAQPGNPDDVVLRSDLWGLFHTRDGGKSWQWVCAEAYGAASLSVNHQNIAIAPGGRVFVANAFRGLRMTDDYCTWNTSAQFPSPSDLLVADVTLSAKDVYVLTSTNSGDNGIDGILWKSTDNGDDFSVSSKLPDKDFAGSFLKFTESDPKRVYVFGSIQEKSGGAMERSDDGGATWKRFEVPVTNDPDKLRFAGLHPTRPDVLFAWSDLSEVINQDSADEIWGSADGGKSWKKVYTGQGDLPGFAFSPDGTEIVIGGPKEGVQRAKLADALAQGQSAFTQQSAGQVWGLKWTAAGITAGTDNFTAKGIPAFTYGASTDEGKTFSAALSICDVKYDACDPSSSLGAACGEVYTGEGGFLQDFPKGPRCVEDPPVSGAGGGAGAGGGTGQGVDAGVTPTPGDRTTSGGCAVGAPTGSHGGTTGAGLFALLVSAAGLGSLRRSRR